MVCISVCGSQYERSRVARKILAQLKEEKRIEEERLREEERRKEEERQRLVRFGVFGIQIKANGRCLWKNVLRLRSCSYCDTFKQY